MTSIVRQVRTAALWAFACSAGAAVCALALPLMLVHALAALDGGASAGVLPIMAVGAAALILRGAFVTVRTRLLSRTALWVRHAAGADVLSHGIDAVQTPNDLDANRDRLERVTAALPLLGQVFDGVLLVVPLGLLLALQPMIGAVAAAALLLGGLIALVITGRYERDAWDQLTSEAVATGAWRTASASSVIIAARGMTASTVNDWQSSHGRAVAKAYQAARTLERMHALLRHLHMSALIVTLAVAVWWVGASVPVAVTAAAIVLQMTILSTFNEAISAVPLIKRAALDLSQLPLTVVPAAYEASPASAVSRPHIDRFAEAS